MEHPVDKIIDILIAILVLFLFPIIFFGFKQDGIVQLLVEAQTEMFVEDIRSNGYISKEMYEYYVNRLSATGLLYDISLEHRHYSFEPEYRFRTAEEIIEEQNKSYTGENKYTYVPVYTDIPHVEDPIDNSGNLNTETNERILAKAERTPPSPTHVHTDECYHAAKHVHTSDCYTYSGSDREEYECGTFTGRMVVHYEYTYRCPCGKSVYEEAGGTEPALTNGTCVYCGEDMELDLSSVSMDQYWQCRGEIEGSGSCNELGSYGGTHIAYRTTSNYTLNCGKKEGAYYDEAGNELSPVCSQIIVKVEPTHPVQTVYTNDPLITTISVTYMDGSTNILKANTTFSTEEVVQNKTATLSYVNVVGLVSTTHTCDITVSVVPRSKTCENGHTYNLNPDGSDPSCPFCKAYLSKLELVIPSNGVIEIYKGTSLPDNHVTLLATYMDGRTEYLYSEYLDNLDTNYVGTQTVTLSYKGKYVYITVITKRNLTKCPVCNRLYELYPDGTDPGCPYCAAKTPVFTGNILEYENHIYDRDILRIIYDENKVYKFSKDDYIQVKVTNKTKGLGNSILGAIIKGINQDFIHVKNGGYIREEK